MLSSPYPVPGLRLWRWAMILGWLTGAAAGAWVIAYPPRTYEGLGLTLTIAWGAMLALGSLLAALAHVIRSYQTEIPGLILALGGITIYSYLSWEQTFTGTWGSGPRALLLVLLACLIVARIRLLLHLDREARRRIDDREANG